MKPHDTLLKFGYPASLVKEYTHWAVLVRSQQATLGALVLVCREEAEAFSEISDGAFAELPRVVRDIEAALKAFQGFDKINYLMLMMVDRQVHYHVLPRYAAERAFAGEVFQDSGWPALPNLGDGPLLQGEALAELVAALRSDWPG